MTTERKRRPTDALSATEWRLAVIATLSTSYVAAWAWLFVPSARETEPDVPEVRVAEGASLVARRPPAVFYDRLPPAERPELVLPAGFRLASSAAAPEPVIARHTQRVPARRPMRIRTRSS